MDILTLGKMVKEKFQKAYGDMSDEDVGLRVANKVGSQFPGPPSSPGNLARVWQHVQGMDQNGAFPTEEVSAKITFPGISEEAPPFQGDTSNLLVGNPLDFQPLEKPEPSAIERFAQGYKTSAIPDTGMFKQIAETSLASEEEGPATAAAGAWEEIPRSVASMSKDLVQNGVKTAVSASLDEDLTKVREGAFQAIVGAVPLIGPMIYDDIEKIKQGENIAGTLGEITGMVADPLSLAGFLATPAWTAKVAAYMKAAGKSKAEINRMIAGVNHQIELIKALAEKEDIMDSYPVSAGIATEAKAKRVKGAGFGKVWGPERLNSDDLYKVTMDYTAECRKRAMFRSTLRELYRKYGADALDQDIVNAIALEARKRGMVGPCSYCYVEGPRRQMAAALGKWEKIMDGTLPAPAGKEAIVQAFRDAGVTSKDVMAENWLWPEAGPRGKGQVVNVNGKDIEFQHYISQQVSAQVKRLDQYEEYMGQLLDMAEPLVDYLNARAGLRFFSSSDFQVEHLPDLIQTLHDAQIMRLRTHAYTKVPDFAYIVKDTGMKVQLSIAAKQTLEGKISEDALDGMAWGDAKRLRKSSPDIGVVLSAPKTDAQIAWGLDQDWIDYILPYHGKDPLAKAMGWKDYSKGYREQWLDPKVGAKGVPPDLQHLVGKDGKPNIRSVDYLDVARGTPDAVAQRRYLDICRRMNVKPLFADVVLPNGKPLIDLKTFKANHPNYIKLKKDYARTETAFNPVDARKLDMRRSMKVSREWAGEGAPTGAPSDKSIVKQVGRLIEMKRKGKANTILKSYAEDPLIQLNVPKK